MALPALRQPNLSQNKRENKKLNNEEINYVILTLKDQSKLVVNSDAFHGILAEADMYKCVFCGSEMVTNSNYKEIHKKSIRHHNMLKEAPFVEEFVGNLIRQINKQESYCTLCNVVLPTYSVARHITMEGHQHEANKAATRAVTYKPNL